MNKSKNELIKGKKNEKNVCCERKKISEMAWVITFCNNG